jgi:hypothetical protein
MSQKKTTPVAKQKRAVTAKRKDAVRSPEVAPEGSSGHWTQSIEPNRSAFLSQMLGPVYFFVKNHGSNNVTLMAHYGDLMDLPPGAVRATYAHGTITVENKGERPALIEFEFMPIYLKP